MSINKNNSQEKGITKDKSIDRNMSPRANNNTMVIKHRNLRRPMKVQEDHTIRRNRKFQRCMNDNPATTITNASSALKKSIEKIISGPVVAAASQCTSNALNSGFTISINSLTENHYWYWIGSVLSAIINTTNPCLSTIATAENTSIQNMIEIYKLIHADRSVVKREEQTVLILAQVYATLENASLVTMRAHSSLANVENHRD